MSSPPRTPWVPVVPPSPASSVTLHLRIEIVIGTAVTDDALAQCTTLFNNNYGKWAPDVQKPLKPGARVRMTPAKMRTQCLSNPVNTVLLLKYLDTTLVGHAFATKWTFPVGVVGWIMQLVVDVKQREQYIATRLLRELSKTPWFAGIAMMGMVSSHPAAIHALCKMLKKDSSSISVPYIRENAPAALQSSSVAYLWEVQPRGLLYEDIHDGTVSLVDTKFNVDHEEVEAVLQGFIRSRGWPLGVLKDGHEFLIIVPTPCSHASSPVAAAGVPSVGQDVFGSRA